MKINLKMNTSCSIFFYEGYVGIAPTIINLAKSLNGCGWSVSIYATENPFPQPKIIGDKTTVTYYRKASDIPLITRIILILYYKFNIKTKLPVIELFFFVCNYFWDLLLNNKETPDRNDINIGVDTNGSILALIKSYFFQQKFIYLSLELNHPTKLRGFANIINLLERLAYRKSEAVIVQDEDRFKTLCEYNQYQHPKVFYLPNSPSSSDSLVQDTQFKNYFREKFNLSKEKYPHIILQAGMIEESVLSEQLAYAFAAINKGYALVFHERQKREVDEPYIKALQEINSKNLFLSLEPLPYEKIDNIFASATIGLAFYKDIDKNYSQISMASGKLSYYLKHGKPVLVSNLDSLSKLVDKYKIGAVIQEASNSLEIESALEMILSNYTFYSENAKTCFEEEFDFSQKIKPILSFMAGLTI